MADTSQSSVGRVFKTSNRQLLRRARSEAKLAEVLPEHLEVDCAYHVISHGDIDSLSYLAHVLKVQPLDYLMISTWVMAATDVKLLERWVDQGRIACLDFNFGEHMPSEYGDIFIAATALSIYTGGCTKVAANHSKVMLGCNSTDNYWWVSESSANVNTNPRIEQTMLTRDQGLFDFYKTFFDGLRSIERKPK